MARVGLLGAGLACVSVFAAALEGGGWEGQSCARSRRGRLCDLRYRCIEGAVGREGAGAGSWSPWKTRGSWSAWRTRGCWSPWKTEHADGFFLTFILAVLMVGVGDGGDDNDEKTFDELRESDGNLFLTKTKNENMLS